MRCQPLNNCYYIFFSPSIFIYYSIVLMFNPDSIWRKFSSIFASVSQFWTFLNWEKLGLLIYKYIHVRAMKGSEMIWKKLWTLCEASIFIQAFSRFLHDYRKTCHYFESTLWLLKQWQLFSELLWKTVKTQTALMIMIAQWCLLMQCSEAFFKSFWNSTYQKWIH